jgi:hypothetical protein
MDLLSWKTQRSDLETEVEELTSNMVLEGHFKRGHRRLKSKGYKKEQIIE